MSEECRLAAILLTDLVGYTAMMEQDAEHARDQVQRSRALIKGVAADHHGECLEESGDATLSVFPSAANAAMCALAIQDAMSGDARLQLRIGLHLGDVVFADGKIYGDGVNVAARVQPLARPGGIAMTEAMRTALRGHPHDIRLLGRKRLKNVSEPVNVYSLEPITIAPAASPKPVARERRHWIAPAVAGAVLCALAALSWIFSDDLRDGVTASSSRAATLAVLPFANVGADPDQEYFADGLTEEMINRLAAIEGLRVSGRTASFALKDTEPSIENVAELFDVATVLEGSVRKAGDQVRISAQLIDAQSGYQLWQQTYERRLDDIFAVQAEIATAVAKELNVVLSAEEDEAVQGRPTTSIAAYNLYLRGIAYLRRPADEANLGFAKVMFRNALREDPSYARAYAGLCRVALSHYKLKNSPVYVDVAEQNCGKALELDKSLDAVRVALGDLYRHTGRTSQAVATYRAVLEKTPGDAEALLGLGQALAAQGNDQAAEIALQRAVLLQPGNWKAQMALGEFRFWQNRFEDSTERFERVIALTPNNVNALGFLGSAYLVTGQLTRAGEVLKQANSLEPSRAVFRNLALIRVYKEDYEGAIELLRKAVALGPEDHWSWGSLAAALYHAGQRDAAHDAHEKAAQLARSVLERNPADWYTMAVLAVYLAYLDQGTQAVTLAQAAIEGAPGNAEVLVYAASVDILLERRGEALAKLEQALADGFPVFLITESALFEPLAGESRFKILVADRG